MAESHFSDPSSGVVVLHTVGVAPSFRSEVISDLPERVIEGMFWTDSTSLYRGSRRMTPESRRALSREIGECYPRV